MNEFNPRIEVHNGEGLTITVRPDREKFVTTTEIKENEIELKFNDEDIDSNNEVKWKNGTTCRQELKDSLESFFSATNSSILSPANGYINWNGQVEVNLDFNNNSANYNDCYLEFSNSDDFSSPYKVSLNKIEGKQTIKVDASILFNTFGLNSYVYLRIATETIFGTTIYSSTNKVQVYSGPSFIDITSNNSTGKNFDGYFTYTTDVLSGFEEFFNIVIYTSDGYDSQTTLPNKIGKSGTFRIDLKESIKSSFGYNSYGSFNITAKIKLKPSYGSNFEISSTTINQPIFFMFNLTHRLTSNQLVNGITNWDGGFIIENDIPTNIRELFTISTTFSSKGNPFLYKDNNKINNNETLINLDKYNILYNCGYQYEFNVISFVSFNFQCNGGAGYIYKEDDFNLGKPFSITHSLDEEAAQYYPNNKEMNKVYLNINCQMSSFLLQLFKLRIKYTYIDSLGSEKFEYKDIETINNESTTKKIEIDMTELIKNIKFKGRVKVQPFLTDLFRLVLPFQSKPYVQQPDVPSYPSLPDDLPVNENLDDGTFILYSKVSESKEFDFIPKVVSVSTNGYSGNNIYQRMTFNVTVRTDINRYINTNDTEFKSIYNNIIRTEIKHNSYYTGYFTPDSSSGLPLILYNNYSSLSFTLVPNTTQPSWTLEISTYFNNSLLTTRNSSVTYFIR